MILGQNGAQSTWNRQETCGEFSPLWYPKASNPYAQCLHLQARASKKVPRPKEMPSFPTEQHVRVLRKSVVRSLLDSDLRKQSRLSWLGWGVKHPLVLLYITMLGSCFAESKPELPSPTFRSHCWPNWPSSRRRNQKHFCSTSQKRSWGSPLSES